jgi:hypothetical protein
VYWWCTAGVGQENRGSRDYEECNIPEIDTSDSPDIPRRKRRGINVSTEFEVSVGRESRLHPSHSCYLPVLPLFFGWGSLTLSGVFLNSLFIITKVLAESEISPFISVAVGQKWKIGTSLREQRSEVRDKGAYFRLGQNFGDYE